MVQGKLSEMTFKETCRMTRNQPLTEWGAKGSIPDGRNNRHRQMRHALGITLGWS